MNRRVPEPAAKPGAELGSALFFGVLGLWLVGFCAGALGAFLLANMAGYAQDRQYGNDQTLGTILIAAAIGWFIYSLLVPFVFAVRLMRGKSGWLMMASPPLLLALAILAMMATL